MVPIEPLTLEDSIIMVVPRATTMLDFEMITRAKVRARLEVEMQFGFEPWFKVEHYANLEP